MSLFSTQLQVALEHAKITRMDLAGKTNIPYRTLSTYAVGERLPDVETIAILCRALPPDEVPALLAARASDEVPAALRHLIWCEPKTGALADTQMPYVPREIPVDLRKGLERLAAAAAESDVWKRAILALADLA